VHTLRAVTPATTKLLTSDVHYWRSHKPTRTPRAHARPFLNPHSPAPTQPHSQHALCPHSALGRGATLPIMPPLQKDQPCAMRRAPKQSCVSTRAACEWAIECLASGFGTLCCSSSSQRLAQGAGEAPQLLLASCAGQGQNTQKAAETVTARCSTPTQRQMHRQRAKRGAA
jgi:hypothetical protein